MQKLLSFLLSFCFLLKAEAQPADSLTIHKSIRQTDSLVRQADYLTILHRVNGSSALRGPYQAKVFTDPSYRLMKIMIEDTSSAPTIIYTYRSRVIKIQEESAGYYYIHLYYYDIHQLPVFGRSKAIKDDQDIVQNIISLLTP